MNPGSSIAGDSYRRDWDSVGTGDLLRKSLVDRRPMTKSNESSLVPVPTEDSPIRARLQRPEPEPSFQGVCVELSREPKAAQLLNLAQEEVVLRTGLSGQLTKGRETFWAQGD